MCTSNTFPPSCLTIPPNGSVSLCSYHPYQCATVCDLALKQVSDCAQWFSRTLAKHIELTQVLLASAKFLSSQDKGRPSAASLDSPPAWLYFLVGWLQPSKMNKMTASNTEREKVKIKWHIRLFHHPEAWHPILEQNEENQTNKQTVHRSDDNALSPSPRTHNHRDKVALPKLNSKISAWELKADTPSDTAA